MLALAPSPSPDIIIGDIMVGDIIIGVVLMPIHQMSAG